MGNICNQKEKHEGNIEFEMNEKTVKEIKQQDEPNEQYLKDEITSTTTSTTFSDDISVKNESFHEKINVEQLKHQSSKSTPPPTSQSKTNTTNTDLIIDENEFNEIREEEDRKIRESLDEIRVEININNKDDNSVNSTETSYTSSSYESSSKDD